MSALTDWVSRLRRRRHEADQTLLRQQAERKLVQELMALPGVGGQMDADGVSAGPNLVPYALPLLQRMLALLNARKAVIRASRSESAALQAELEALRPKENRDEVEGISSSSSEESEGEEEDEKEEKQPQHAIDQSNRVERDSAAGAAQMGGAMELDEDEARIAAATPPPPVTAASTSAAPDESLSFPSLDPASFASTFSPSIAPTRSLHSPPPQPSATASPSQALQAPHSGGSTPMDLSPLRTKAMVRKRSEPHSCTPMSRERRKQSKYQIC
jgi:hypothetical protein